MFYVEKWRKDKKRELAILHIGPPVIVFLAFLGITLWSWIDAKNNITENQSSVLTSNIAETQKSINSRLNTYEDLLRAGVGVFNSSTEVTRSEWKQFINILEISERYPGILGIGYSAVIPAEQVEAHELTFRDNEYPRYSVFPKRQTPQYTSIVFLEPKNSANQKAIGYDMTSEKIRKATMELARDSGDTAVSDIVALIQDNGGTERPGFLMYVPRFTNPDVKTIEERRQNIAGYVYAPFRSDELLREIDMQLNLNGFEYQVFDSTTDDEHILFETGGYQELSNNPNRMEKVSEFDINNQKWIIRAAADTSIIPQEDNNRPLTILWAGILFSTFLAFFIYILLLNRTRALSSKEANEIQEAKDELLALASHQLRTPATGVKQYLGLLREGYAGSLNKDQRTYINKAYQSNERQLTTINQMLFVARSDAGKIKLTVRRINITDLIKDILDEQKSAIKDKKHKLTVNFPDHSVDIYGDEQYLRMAMENVISNAVKYTDVEGKIEVSVSQAGNDIRIIVEDNGVGVNPDDLPLLFRKFSRIPNELTSKVSGSGIGLYLTKSIIKAHKGNVAFESVPGSGSTVTVVLPSKLPKESGYL